MTKALIFSAILFTVLACDTSKKNVEQDALPPVEVPPSYLSLRVNFPAVELEKGVNSILPRTLIDGAFPMKDEKDSLFLTVTRNGTLSLEVKDNEVYAAIPLNIKASAQKRVLGVTLSNKDNPIYFSATIHASTQISLQDNWDMGFICKWNHLELHEDPKLSFMGLKFSVGSAINNAIDDYSDNLSDILCRSLRESISLNTVLEDVYNDLQATHRIAKNPQPLYLRSSPVALHGELVPASKDTLSIHLEYRTKIHISPENRIIVNRQALNKRSEPMNTNQAIVAYPELVIPYTFLASTLEDLLRDEQFEYEGYKVTVKEVNVFRKGQALDLAVRTEGDLKGIIHLVGKPSLDDDMEFSLSDFEYTVEAKNSWVKMTDFAIHKLTEEYLSSQLKINLKNYFDQLDDLIMQQIEHGVIGKKISLRLSFDQLKSYNLILTETGIQWILMVEGKSSIDLKGGLLNSTNS